MTAEPMRPRPLVIFRVDASDRIGGGHLMRCLALADALAVRGVGSTFVGATVPSPLAQRVAQAGHELLAIEPAAAGSARREALPDPAQLLDAERTVRVLGPRRARWLVLDHYGLSAPWARAVRKVTENILVIDDLANREHDADLLLDATLGREAEDYAGLVPSGCTVVLGPRYALLRQEFARSRPDALRRRRSTGTTDRVLLSLGATDVGGVTLPALEAVLAAALEVTVDVVLSSQAPSLPAVRRLAAQRQDVAVHVDQSDMAALLAGADLAVGAAGTSSWERCCLALPTVSLVLADNQRLVAARLADLGAAVAVDSTADITVVVRELAHDRLRRAEMAAAAAAVTDGTGAAVVTDLMIDAATTGSPATGLRVRPVDPNDAERLWLWRNDPQTRAMARTPAVVTWQSHATWFERTLAEGRSRLLMVESADEPVAMVRCDDLDEDEALVSINVAPSARGRGVGGQALALACAEHDRDRPGVALVAEILTSNTASLRIFQTNGFREQAQTSGKFRRFVRPTADLAGG